MPASILLLAALPACPLAQDDAPDLHVRLALDAPARTLNGSLSLEGTEGPVEISFAEGYAFMTLEPRLVGELSASSGGARLEVAQVSPFVWRIERDGDAPIELTWAVRIDHREHPDVIAAIDGYEQPFASDELAMLFTGALVPVPRLAKADVSVTITPPVDAEGTPWPVLAPWPDGPDGTFAPTLDALRDDILLLGPWHARPVEAGGLVATFAFAPGEERYEALVESHLGPIVEHEVTLFGGAPQPRFLFVFGPGGDMRGYGGSPKTNAMTLFVGTGLPEDSVVSGVSHLVAHEFHHTWMRARCRPTDDLRFVMEGFTDYFAWRTAWQLGHLADEAYLAELEQQLAKARRALSGYGRALTDAGGPEFFLGREAYDACYAGGLTIALWTELALRRLEDPRTLEEFLRAFYNDERWQNGTNPTVEDWTALLAEWLGDESAAAHVAAIGAEGGFDPVALFATAGLEVTHTEKSAGNSPRANFDGATLLQLDPAGPAALVGLHAGDVLVEINGKQVATEGDVRRAWREAPEGRLKLVFRRGEDTRTLDVPVPTRSVFELPRELLERLV